AVAHRVNDAREVVTDPLGERRRYPLSGRAAPEQAVERLDAGGVDSDANLTAARPRGLDVDDLEDLGTSVSREDQRFTHDPTTPFDPANGFSERVEVVIQEIVDGARLTAREL